MSEERAKTIDYSLSHRESRTFPHFSDLAACQKYEGSFTKVGMFSGDRFEGEFYHHLNGASVFQRLDHSPPEGMPNYSIRLVGTNTQRELALRDLLNIFSSGFKLEEIR